MNLAEDSGLRDSFSSSAQEQPSDPSENAKVTSLKELVDYVTGRSAPVINQLDEEYGSAEFLPFPFLALVGQKEMKLGLLLALINPAVGGVLLIGPRGTGKTTAVRSLLDLLPMVERSNCFYGCMPEDIEIGGMDAVCPDCAKKFAEGVPLTRFEKAALVELPLNSKLEDVIGGLDQRLALQNQARIKRGILAQANQNILYIDEINLLNREIADAILDAAAMGSYTVRRGPVSATYKSKFTLIGSMNPEEGALRPQIMDRFGLRVLVKGLENPVERKTAYSSANSYFHNPRMFKQLFKEETQQMAAEIQQIRSKVKEVVLPDSILENGVQLVQALRIDSLRAEITLFEAARAYAAMDNRFEVELNDIRRVAPIALRLRQSPFIDQYFSERLEEDSNMQKTIDSILPEI